MRYPKLFGANEIRFERPVMRQIFKKFLRIGGFLLLAITLAYQSFGRSFTPELITGSYSLPCSGGDGCSFQFLPGQYFYENYPGCSIEVFYDAASNSLSASLVGDCSTCEEDPFVLGVISISGLDCAYNLILSVRNIGGGTLIVVDDL